MIDLRYISAALNYHGITVDQYKTAINNLEQQCEGLDLYAMINVMYDKFKSLNIKHLPSKPKIIILVKLINKLSPSNFQTFVNRVVFILHGSEGKEKRGGSYHKSSLETKFQQYMQKLGLIHINGDDWIYRPIRGEDWGLHRYAADGSRDRFRANLIFLFIDNLVGLIFSIVALITFMIGYIVYELGSKLEVWTVMAWILTSVGKIALKLIRLPVKAVTSLAQSDNPSSAVQAGDTTMPSAFLRVVNGHVVVVAQPVDDQLASVVQSDGSYLVQATPVALHSAPPATQELAPSAPPPEKVFGPRQP